MLTCFPESSSAKHEQRRMRSHAQHTQRCSRPQQCLARQRLCAVIVRAAAPSQGRTQATGKDSAPRQRIGSGKPSPSSRRQEEEEEEPDVPEVGWLWAAADSGTKQGAVPNPSARMTVADLRQDRIKAKKSLGQNFLTDDGILREIVRAAGVRPGDWVLEVGPGTGNLTKHLLAAGAQVVAVEKDDVLYARLAETYAQVPSLRLVHADVLRLNLQALMQEQQAAPQALMQEEQTAPQAASASGEQEATGEAGAATGATSAAQPELPQEQHQAATTITTTTTTTAEQLATAETTAAAVGPTGPPPSPSTSPLAPLPGGRFKVVANLPYNITTDFLKVTLPLGHLISDLHIMLQDEAGKRLVHSQPHDADYRAMSVRVALYSKPKYRFSIPREKYYPVPGVNGALITFSLIPRAPQRLALASDRVFLSAVDKGFGERRKKLRNSLQPIFSAEQVEASLVQLGLEPTARAQDLSVAQWAALYNLMQQWQEARGADAPPPVDDEQPA